MKTINKSVALLSASALLVALATGCATSKATQTKAPTPIPSYVVEGPVEVRGPVNVTGPVTVTPAATASVEKTASFSAVRPVSSSDTTLSAVRSAPTQATFQATPGAASSAAATATLNGGLSGERDSGEIELKKEVVVTGTQVAPNGAVQIKKTIVTENVNTVVPVRREEYTVTDVNVTDKTPKTPFEAKEITIPLSREVPTGSTKAEVYRIIKVKTTIETDTPTVQGQVRTEKVDVTRQP